MRLHCESPQSKRFAYNRTSWWRSVVFVPADEQNHWTKCKHDGWKKKGQPKPNVFLRIDHGNRAD